MKKTLMPEWLPYALLALASVALALIAGWSSYGERINRNFLDLYFRQRGPQPAASADHDIVIVALDDATLARFGALPLPRSVLAQAIRTILNSQPRLLAVDLILSDASAADSDQSLAAALRSSRPVVLATALETAPGGRWLNPLPDFSSVSAAIGHVHADPDPDGVNRRILLAKQGGRERYWALALESYRLLQGSSPPLITETNDDLVVAGPAAPGTEVHIPARRNDERSLWINFAGGNDTFPQISLTSLMDQDVHAALRDKIVFLGVTAQGAGDRLFTPFSSGLGMPGVEIHSNALHTLLSGKFLLPAAPSAVLLALFFISLLTAASLAWLHGPRLAIALAVIGVAVLAAPYLLFLQGSIWPGFLLLGQWVTASAACGSYRLLVVGRKLSESEIRRRRSQQQFEMAAHEIRSPLMAIQGSSELLQRYHLDDAKREQMTGLIFQESQRMGRLVERFLSAERLTAGEMELRPAPLNLPALAATVVDQLRAAADRKSIQLHCSANGVESEINADRELLEMAIYNLLTNAIKYCPSGSAVDLILDQNPKGIAVQVADNGPGMDKEECRHIFDRFYRTDTAQRSGAPGYGLGLFIAREIALHHGGDLTVESSLGAGSRFTIYLPCGISEGRT
ncbi:MAG: hypothetical protein A3F68_00525 [Acidobacteria bacterium RIFCSPLOWO2_12_FULL_54_10]|nr:MAG: hypothetical protein A3F68_00525 [Acidobacteria bacterium RIFCSPLOWO2_12_FULL_54_10]